MLQSIANQLLLLIAIFHCSKSAYPLVSRSGATVVRYARQAGYVYDRPKVPFELSIPSTARPPPSTQQPGYAYTAGNTAEPVSIGYSKGSTANSGSSYATQTTRPAVSSSSYGKSQSIATSAGSTVGGLSTGYNYATQTAVTERTQFSSAGPSYLPPSNGPTYLPPPLSPSVSNNGIVTSSYSGASTVSTSASTTAAPVSPTDVYLPPNKASPTTPQANVYISPSPSPTTRPANVYVPPSPSPTTRPANVYVPPSPSPTTRPANVYVPPSPSPTTRPANVYVPPSPSSPSSQGTPPSISTPAPTYLPPYL